VSLPVNNKKRHPILPTEEPDSNLEEEADSDLVIYRARAYNAESAFNILQGHHNDVTFELKELKEIMKHKADLAKIDALEKRFY
jgi:hypothetical protein